VRQKVWRGTIYAAGLVILAIGLIFNTKSGIGASALISIPVAVSELWDLNLGLLTMGSYCVYILLEIALLRRRFRLFDLLQIPVSIVFSWLINLFNDLIQFQTDNLAVGIAIMLAGIVLTGIGAALSLDMQLIPNAGDGLVRALSLRTGKDIGLCKNILDVSSVTITVLLGLIFAGHLIVVGVGTVLSMIFVGRVMHLVNHLFKEKLLTLSGLDDEFAAVQPPPQVQTN
jgi:uncharacterized membrane protein YczE